MEHAPLPLKDVFHLSPPRDRPSLAFPLGLGDAGLHEICEASHGDFAAMTGFALAARAHRKGPIVWIRQAGLKQSHGLLLQAGYREISTNISPCLTIMPRKLSETLWATEEAIRSGVAALVIAELEDTDFTASRRLALAAGRHGVPVLLLMPYSRDGATAASARWRISPRPSSPNRYDPKAPGALRWKAVLERSRQAPHMAGQSFDLELDDETLSLRVVSGLAADPVATRPSWAQDRIGPSHLRQSA
ncbi:MULTISPECIES: ImuA family protein [Hyphomonas]|jgi:protein ImuA|uniref:ImuA family protein n=3 Tax=Hyphomonas TaxID=85 RepID=UPI0035137E23